MLYPDTHTERVLVEERRAQLASDMRRARVHADGPRRDRDVRPARLEHLRVRLRAHTVRYTA